MYASCLRFFIKKRRRRANLLIGKEDKLVDSIVIDRKK